RFKQYGIELSRKTIAHWMIKSSNLLNLIYQRLKEMALRKN
ncbi:MAG: transposase, partial [Aestuariibacter sp.]|nr:transposase [Aestuariibacter sp.]